MPVQSQVFAATLVWLYQTQHQQCTPSPLLPAITAVTTVQLLQVSWQLEHQPQDRSHRPSKLLQSFSVPQAFGAVSHNTHQHMTAVSPSLLTTGCGSKIEGTIKHQ